MAKKDKPLRGGVKLQALGHNGWSSRVDNYRFDIIKDQRKCGPRYELVAKNLV